MVCDEKGVRAYPLQVSGYESNPPDGCHWGVGCQVVCMLHNALDTCMWATQRAFVWFDQPLGSLAIVG